MLQDPHQVELLRKRFELAQLSLPRDQYPLSVASAREVADVWLNDPDLWWEDMVDLVVFGLEGLAAGSSSSKKSSVEHGSAPSATSRGRQRKVH
jgi:hypothetical protein